MPEVSRVTHEAVDGASTNHSDFLLQLFNHPRSFSELVISYICVVVLFITGSPTLSVGGQYCFARCRRRLLGL